MDTQGFQPDRPAEAVAQSARGKSSSGLMRPLAGFWHLVFSLLGFSMVGFYLYSAGATSFDEQYFRGIYVLLTYVMILLAYPLQRRVSGGDGQHGRTSEWLFFSREHPTALDLALCLVAVAVTGYYMLESESFNFRAGSENYWDVLVSLVGLAISFEISRRVLGWSITVVGLFFLVYGIWGNYFPEPFTHRGYSLERLAPTLFMTYDGIFGVMVHVLINYVILFIFFGAFLQRSGVGQFFIEWPLALAGRTTGGPAKVAVITSAFFGSISGSAIANTVSTGSFTIPLMKKAGFRPHVAGAIDPTASIGGMFMPPIMGAGGFLMAELTDTPYREIMLLSLFPALLYFFAVLTQVHFEAKKHHIVGLVDPAIGTASQIFVRHWYKIIPLVTIVVLMLVGYSPSLAALWGIIACVAVSWLDPKYRMGAREIWKAATTGARDTLIIGATVGMIGIIIGTIAVSGMGPKLTGIIISLSHGNLPLALILVGLASLILGMGVPVTASYLIVAVVAVPAMTALLETEVPAHSAFSLLIASHMIIYWFSQDSNITPPVCIAAYAGAAIAGSDPWKTGWTCFKFAKLLYVVPFLFAYHPAFLLEGSWIEIALTFTLMMLGTVAFSGVTMGYLIRKTSLVERFALVAIAFLCYYPSYWVGLVGAIGLAIVWACQRHGVHLSATPAPRSHV